MPVGQSAAEYKVILTKGVVGQCMELEDQHTSDTEKEGDSGADDASSDAAFQAGVVAPRAAPKQRQQRGGVAPARRRIRTSANDWAALVWDDGSPAAAPVHAGASPAPLPIADAAQASDGQVVVHEAAEAVSQRASRKKPYLLEGAELEEEAHGVLGQPGSYRRLRAVCNVATHVGCKVQRSFSAWFGRASGLGDQEPFAFIGCWLRAGASFSDASQPSHSQWKPTVAQVQAYAESMGWRTAVDQ